MRSDWRVWGLQTVNVSIRESFSGDSEGGSLFLVSLFSLSNPHTRLHTINKLIVGLSGV